MQNKIPFFTLRTDCLELAPCLAEEICKIIKKYPGSCDEIWLADGSFDDAENLRIKLERKAKILPYLKENGIQLAFQQCITLNHSPNDAFRNPEQGIHKFSDDDWQVDKDGNRLYGMLCPRSQEGREHLYAYIRQILETLRPTSYWLDDDLRLGVHKPFGCFCERCLHDFNEANHTAFSREELVEHLFGNAAIDPIREKWCAFNEESLAGFAVQLRHAADDVLPECMLGYQAVWSTQFYTGRTNIPLLSALSGEKHCPVGIRPGAYYYSEINLAHTMIYKSYSIAREAELCKQAGFIPRISYEQETCPRIILHKSPEAIMIESALALGSGCNSLTECISTGNFTESLKYFEHYCQTASAYRPYLEFLALRNEHTHLGAVARYRGENCYMHKDFDLIEESEIILARCGIPMTAAEAHPSAWLVTAQSIQHFTENDLDRLLELPVVMECDAFEWLVKEKSEWSNRHLVNAARILQYYQESIKLAGYYTWNSSDEPPTIIHYERDANIPDEWLKTGGCFFQTGPKGRWAIVSMITPLNGNMMWLQQRNQMIDSLDWVTNNHFPVRIDTCHAMRVLPRITDNGSVDSVTMLNISIGETPEIEICVRHPHGTNASWHRPRQQAVPIVPKKTSAMETCYVLPILPGWQIGTLVFE